MRGTECAGIPFSCSSRLLQTSSSAGPARGPASYSQLLPVPRRVRAAPQQKSAPEAARWPSRPRCWPAPARRAARGKKHPRKLLNLRSHPLQGPGRYPASRSQAWLPSGWRSQDFIKDLLHRRRAGLLGHGVGQCQHVGRPREGLHHEGARLHGGQHLYRHMAYLIKAVPIPGITDILPDIPSSQQCRDGLH